MKKFFSCIFVFFVISCTSVNAACFLHTKVEASIEAACIDECLLWNEGDIITVQNNAFKAVKSGYTTTFISQTKGLVQDNNTVYATYPESTLLSGKFSLSNQNGTLESIHNCNLLTAVGFAGNEELNLNFKQYISILEIPTDSVPFYGTISSIRLDVPSEFKVTVVGNGFKVTELEASGMLSINLSINNGDTIYVAFIPTTTTVSYIPITIFDDAGAEFHYINRNSVSVGQICKIGGDVWTGGIPISFNPTTGSWNSVDS